ncbi:UTRA domain-containing protein [Roseomonas terrae]|jgi:GntR family histidine utilization transcriptional repressor|uniref:UTRA domain-containing protein n=1 Tax=Neoroseomonas terrae TaxID=424799 RepID=A0ABS5EDU1_9PROT|nr:UTRA domain-containing protein [Neoroseomonas terrae]MBR0648882.1 UTRA domain-containing protein [Neoroseomonas terrae]
MTALTLDGDGPLHAQIRRALGSAILTGRIPPGGRIPPENELMALFGASRMTVHRAVAALAAEGLVRRNRRAGTVASPEARGRAVFEIWDIGAEIAAAGQQHRFDILSRTIRPATGEEMDLAAGTPLLDITTRHLADATPMQVEERLINLDAAPDAAAAPFSTTPPGRWLLDHVPWTEAEHAIHATAAPARVATLLGMTRGAAALVVERRTWNGATPVTFARLWHAGDRHRLVGRFAAGASPARG